MSFGFKIHNAECLDLAKPASPISTGVGFLDHMIDQFNSHAQVGVALSVETDSPADSKNRFASLQQKELVPFVGASLGDKFRILLAEKQVPAMATSRFCCPLDEALVECVLVLQPQGKEGRLSKFTLPPYGAYPRSTGRTKIGSLETACIQDFMRALAQHSGLDISLHKLRGDNGHHIVESSFKALSRALRNLLDKTDTVSFPIHVQTQRLWGVDSPGYQQSLALRREGKVERKTKETAISVQVRLDGGRDGSRVHTGLAALDEFFSMLAREAHMTLQVNCKGDLWVDDHHTSEDVAIAVGQVLNEAFGTKAGLNRMWCAQGHEHGAEVEVTMDLSNRPCLTHNLTLADSGQEYVDEHHLDWTVEMFHHVLESLVMNARMTVHVLEIKPGSNVMDRVMATAIAFGRALRFCATVDPRRAGATASSKGTLSV